MNKDNICKGCRSYYFKDGCVILPIIHKGSDKETICPCSTCLIKMMCDHECELFMNFQKIVIQHNRQQINKEIHNNNRRKG